MEYKQIKVNCSVSDLEQVCAVMSMVDNGLMIEDYSDADENLKSVYGDLLDERILNADKTRADVSVFIPLERSPIEAEQFLKERFTALNISTKITVIGVADEDWASSWKKYYKPTPIGEKIVVVPAWEKYSAKPDEVIVRMDPGMAFGTGSHETTRLVGTLIEKYLKKGDKVLDVGTGSGILAIISSLLGAHTVDAYDIDPVAVKVAKENIKDNNVTNVTCEVSDLLKSVKKDSKYDLISANIVADIIIRMSPELADYADDGCIFIASGIINTRCDEVIEAMSKTPFELIEVLDEKDWVAIAFVKKKS